MRLDFKKLPNQIAIVGSRSFAKNGPSTDRWMRDIVHRFVKNCPYNIEVVSGGAMGIDAYAKEAASMYMKRYREFPPDIKKYGSPKAFFVRNDEIVRYIHQMDGVIVAFTDSQSSNGTRRTMESARRASLPVIEYRFEIGHPKPVYVDIPKEFLNAENHGMWGLKSTD